MIAIAVVVFSVATDFGGTQIDGVVSVIAITLIFALSIAIVVVVYGAFVDSTVSPTTGMTFNEGEVVTFEFIVNDDIDAPSDLTLVFASDFQGDLEAVVSPDSTGAGTFSTANLEVANHVITVTAVDSYGQSASDYVDIVIEDVPDAPEISVVHPTGGEFGQENSFFEFVAEVFDARDDAETLQVAFSSDLDGEFCQPEPDAEGFARCEAELSPGEHTLTYTVTNSLDFNDSATVYFVVQPTEDIDDDGDGFTENQGDCDDGDPSINPIADEVENGVDDDCNGEIDDGDIDVASAHTTVIVLKIVPWLSTGWHRPVPSCNR